MATAGYSETAHPDLNRIAENVDAQAEALEAAASQIDAALQAGGYTTPVDFSAMASSTAKTRLQALFAIQCRALAALHLTAGQTGTDAKTEKDATSAQAWLERVRNGIEELPLIGRRSPHAITAVSGRGLREDATTGDFGEDFWTALRTHTGAH